MTLADGTPRTVHTGPGLENHLHCVGKFGMGNGYSMVDKFAYCAERCPFGSRPGSAEEGVCWERTKRALENEHPADVESFQRFVRDTAVRFGWTREKAGRVIAEKLMEHGTPDPYRKYVLHWTSQGMDARRRDDPGVGSRVIVRGAG